VATWMAGADLYVQPSRPLHSGRTEGLPVATLEALAAGLPVLASATGGLAELPYGPPRLRLVPPGDPAALAACLEQ
jgi:glycosyltransferase involved in cell wall biosynthesis